MDGHQHNVVAVVNTNLAVAGLLLEAAVRKAEETSWVSEVMELVSMAADIGMVPAPTHTDSSPSQDLFVQLLSELQV